MYSLVRTLPFILFLQCLICLTIVPGTYSNNNSTLDKTKTKPKVVRTKVAFQYHNYDKMTEFLKLVEKKFPNLTHLYSIVQSVEGRQLWVLNITE